MESIVDKIEYNSEEDIIETIEKIINKINEIIDELNK
tara:strand:+ start:501 stop:611 length:111 start_codon:yes stop_codon:yes gene_type:complete